MTFQIFVGGQRVNSDHITSTPAWADAQGKSRKRDAFEGDARDDELARANAHAGKRAFVSPQGGVHQGDLMVAGGENPGGRQQRGHHLHVFQRPTRPLGELGCQVFVTPQQGGYDHPW